MGFKSLLSSRANEIFRWGFFAQDSAPKTLRPQFKYTVCINEGDWKEFTLHTEAQWILLKSQVPTTIGVTL